MEQGELRGIAKSLEIQCQKNDTNAVLIQRINESGKYDNVSTGSSVKGEVKNGVKMHPDFGKYYDVIIRPIKPEDQGTSVFVSINSYTADFQPNQKVSLPAGIIKFLKSAIVAEHYFDKSYISENGNVGAHRTRYVPKYIIQKADDEF